MSDDRWLIVRPDGRLIIHTENDGWTYLRRGAEAVEREVDAETLRRNYDRLYEVYEKGRDYAGPGHRLVVWESD